MIKGDNIAKRFRTAENMLIKRNENSIWVSDTYVLIKLEENEFKRFYRKYNGYRTTYDIPVLEPGQTFREDSNENKITDEDPIGILISEYEKVDLKEARLLNFSYKYKNRNCRMYRYDKRVGLIDDKYSFVVENRQPVKLACGGENEPLIIKKSNRIVALIMPVRKGNDLSVEIKSLTKIAS